MSSISKSVKNYIISKGIVTEDKIFVAYSPKITLNSDGDMVIYAAGGSANEGGNILKWKRTHRIAIAYRSSENLPGYELEDKLFEIFNDCTRIEDYQVITASLTPQDTPAINEKETKINTWFLDLTIVRKELQ